MKEAGKNPEIKIDQQTPEQILRETSQQFNELTLKADEAFSCKNLDGVIQKFTERAQLIVKLPLKIQKSIDQGNYFSKSDMEDINDMSSVAQKALDRGTVFTLGSIFEGQGNDDKSYLDELIDRIYPQK